MTIFGQEMSVKLGIDNLRDKGFGILRGERVGLVVNPASVDSGLRPTADIVLREKRVCLMALFGPQHGIRGETQANMVEWEGHRDPHTNLPVLSLYGKRRKPTREMLREIDALVFDLPDVGSRYYTYIWTMALCMQSCAECGKHFVVLDRPNPINGVSLEGPVLSPDFSSFVGLYPIPVRHGMTVGELALMFNKEFNIGCNLEIVPLIGWDRKKWLDETGLQWVMPSPNMPTLETATVYPGLCLLEGTNISEGRGTTRPFEIFGAPWITPHDLLGALDQETLGGVAFRPVHFTPTFDKWMGELCGGLQIHVLDRDRFPPFFTGLAIIRAINRLYPDQFGWKGPPYEYEEVKLPFDILVGSDKLRLAIEKGESLQTMRDGWIRDLEGFGEVRKQYLLY
jgi:uncharacterized protein YbbC (DUF1343 family)